MSSLKFALMLMACGMATPFVFLKECEPKDFTAIELTGSSLTVRVWVPERSDGEILRLFINDNNLANTNISINKAAVKIENKGQHREINILEEYNKTIPHGWTEFQVTVDREFRVFVPAIQQTIVDEDDFVEADTLHIQRKQVTVNCFTSLTQWRVAHGSPASVPLAGLGPHHFALFSRKAFLPSLRAGSLRLDLHWDPESKAVSTSSSNPQPLPAFTLHNFTLKCERIPKNWKCDVMWENGGHGTLVDSVLLKEVDSLFFVATDKIDYVVQYTLKDQETTIEEKLPGKGENGAGEGDEKRPDDVDGWLPPIILGCLALSVAVFPVIQIPYLYRRVDKYWNKRSGTLSIPHTASVEHNQERPRSWRTIPQRSRPRRPFSNSREGGQEENGGHEPLVDSVLLKEVGSLSFAATDKRDSVVQDTHKDQETTIEEKLLGKGEHGAGEEDKKRPYDFNPVSSIRTPENDGHEPLVDSVLLKEVDSLSVDATDKIGSVVQDTHKDQETTVEEKLPLKKEKGAGEKNVKRLDVVDIFVNSISEMIIEVENSVRRLAKSRIEGKQEEIFIRVMDMQAREKRRRSVSPKPRTQSGTSQETATPLPI